MSLEDRAVEGAQGPGWLEDAVRWAAERSLERVVVMAPQVGPWESPIERLRTALHDRGIELALGQRRWDRVLYPYTDRGYFKLRKVISRGTVLESLYSPAAVSRSAAMYS